MVEKDKYIKVNSRKYDGRIDKSWNAKILATNKSLLVLFGKFDKEIKHPDLGVIRRGTMSYEFFWFDCWYNIFRFHEPDGSLRNYYCNVIIPPTFDNQILNYIDLDVDILIWKDFSYLVLDMDEFEKNKLSLSYSDDLVEKVKMTVKDLISMVENKIFPFDYEDF